MTLPIKHPPPHRLILTGAAVLLPLLLALPSPVRAEPSIALDRVSISAGGFYVRPSFSGRADTNFGRLETGDVDRNRTTLPRVRAEILLGDSQGFSFDYFRYRSNYQYGANRTINVGGASSTLNAQANANLGVDFASAAYKWWFGRGSSVFGIGAGAGYYRANVGVNASGTFNGAAGNLSEGTSEHAVAPLLELGWKYAFTPDLRLYAEASGVRKNWGSTRGHLYNAALGVEWYPLKNLGIGADYGISRVHIHRNQGDAALDVKLTGPSAYVKLRY